MADLLTERAAMQAGGPESFIDLPAERGRRNVSRVKSMQVSLEVTRLAVMTPIKAQDGNEELLRGHFAGFKIGMDFLKI